MALKWDTSFTRRNTLFGRTERIREMRFQDHASAQELTDVDNRHMTLREFGTGEVLSYASREGRRWICTRYTENGTEGIWADNKQEAVDFLLGRPVPGKTL